MHYVVFHKKAHWIIFELPDIVNVTFQNRPNHFLMRLKEHVSGVSKLYRHSRFSWVCALYL